MDDMINKKQNRKVTIFAIVLSVISIGLLVGGFFLVSSDRVVMLQSLSNLANKVEAAFDDNELSDKLSKLSDIGVKTNVKLSSDSINGSLKFDYLENQADKKSKVNVDLSVSEQELLSFEGVMADDNFYLYVDDITPNYYYTVFEYVNVFTGLNIQDYDKMFDLLKDAITNNIDNDVIKKEKVEVTYNDKSKKVNKLSYAMTNKDVKNMIASFVDSLKKDKKLLTSIAESFNISNDDVIAGLDSYVNAIIIDEVKNVFNYNVYYYGFNKIIRYELADIENNPIIEYKVEDKETISFYTQDVEFMKLEISKVKNDFVFSGFINGGDMKIPFSGTSNDNNLIIIVDINGNLIELAVTFDEQVKENNYIYNNKFVLSITSEGQKVEIGTLDVNLEYYFDQKVDVDLSGSINADEVTEDDLTVIEENLMKHPIYYYINGLMGNSNIGL